MKIDKKELEKSQVELTIELSLEDFKPFIVRGAEIIAKEIKIEGFRPGKAPYDILKKKIGEMTILEEAARQAINKTLAEAIKKSNINQAVGQPQISITKLAPDNPLEYKAVLSVLPSVDLGIYKGLGLKDKKVEVKEEEAAKLIEELREMRVKEEISEEAIKDNDKALLDIQMFLDKVPIEGGQGKGVAIIVGKNYIIPGFDKKLIGVKKGDIREFPLPYPKSFHMKNLAGKMVDFKVEVKDIFNRKLPGLDDAFAISLGAKNMEDLKENVKKSVLEQKKKENIQKTESEMLNLIMEKSKFGDIPQVLIEHEGDAMLRELEESIIRQGGKFEDYLSSLNKTKDRLVLEMLPEAIKRIKISLLIREIGNKEKIEADDREVDKQIENIKKQHRDNKELMSKTDSNEYKNYVYNILTTRKVVDKLREWNVE